MTTYGYAEGSPLMYSDPEGLAAAFFLRMGIRYFAPRFAARAAMRAAKLQASKLAVRAAKRVSKKIPSCSAIGKKTVFSGHGGYEIGSGVAVVPKGTSLTVYSRFGTSITDRLGNVIEAGGNLSKVYSRTYTAGQRVPNYTLYPPEGLKIVGNPTTVSSSTKISELLKPGMGSCHWAACTHYSGASGANVIYDTVGIGNSRTMQWLLLY